MGSAIEKALGLAILFLAFCMASGHKEWVWKGIAYAQYQASKNIRKPWGNPSIFLHSHPGKNHYAHRIASIEQDTETRGT